MSFNKKTIKDVELSGKKVLLRADYNVPMRGGMIEDDYRLRQSLPTIKYILEHGADRLVIISHLGRPSGPRDKDCSLKPVAKRLAHLLDRHINFIEDCVGEEVKKAIADLPAGGIIVLENLRFHPEEEKNDPSFARALADTAGADIFVADGFGVVHRAHASTEAITRILPSVAGLLIALEVGAIESVMKDPVRPLTAVIGGVKVTDKIDVLSRFMELADCVAIGGALAHDFLVAEKIPIGKSIFEADALDTAREIIQKARKMEKEKNFNFLIPVDGVVSTSSNGKSPTRIVDFGSHSLADIQSYPKRPPHRSYTVEANERVLDIGPISAARIAGAVQLSKTVVWSGPLGLIETPGIAGAANPFGHASRVVGEAMIGGSNLHAHKPFSLVGGGDTVSYVQSQGWIDDFSHVSTGGSAGLELLAGHKLPGVEALENK